MTKLPMTNDAAAELLLPSTLPTLAPEAMPKIARVVIVACGKAKLDHAAQAQDLYVGGLFKAARAHAEATASRWFVASAKHGLIAPELVIAPYDQKLGSGSATRFVKDTTIDTWAENCRAQFVALMGEHGLDGVIVEILAGADYVGPLAKALEHALEGAEVRIENPLAGLQVGERLAWFKAARIARAAGALPAVDPAFYARALAQKNHRETFVEPVWTEEETEEVFARLLARTARQSRPAPRVRRKSAEELQAWNDRRVARLADLPELPPEEDDAPDTIPAPAPAPVAEPEAPVAAVVAVEPATLAPVAATPKELPECASAASWPACSSAPRPLSPPPRRSKRTGERASRRRPASTRRTSTSVAGSRPSRPTFKPSGSGSTSTRAAWTRVRSSSTASVAPSPRATPTGRRVCSIGCRTATRRASSRSSGSPSDRRSPSAALESRRPSGSPATSSRRA